VRLGKIRHAFWRFPLPVFAIIAGGLLFLHTHGDHPGAHTIAVHHTIMGTLAIFAGTFKLAGPLWYGKQTHTSGDWSAWDVAWAGLILVIGAQLLIYTE